jgi:hypothetical protein
MNVAFFVFNRPDVTRLAFEAIRGARPSRLLLVADGPRTTHATDEARCATVRTIVSDVDWPCEVLTEFAEQNLGCRRRMASGIDWVFANVEDAVILEDDCLPSPEFFTFTSELLERYRDEPSVMHISGSRLTHPSYRPEYSYYFSRKFNIWGWATWRRAWCFYDRDLQAWPEFRDNGWPEALSGNPAEAAGIRGALDAVYNGRMDTWDWQWFFTCWCRGGLSVDPAVNLVSNVGFGHADATHTTRKTRDANRQLEKLGPLRHPPFLVRDLRSDQADLRAYRWERKIEQFRTRCHSLSQRIVGRARTLSCWGRGRSGQFQ